jgi:hypothetical protein
MATGKLDVSIFQATSTVPTHHPTVSVTVPPNYKILGGGAQVFYTGVGSLLTASYPSRGPNGEYTIWNAAAKDPAAHPMAVATLPAGYTMTGGGAFVNYGTGSGNLLTASFPSNDIAWEARSKDHILSDPAPITAYVLGLRSKIGIQLIFNLIESATTIPSAHPSEAIEPGGVVGSLTCGGAIDYWTGAGNMLTCSYPTADGGWFAAGKDHIDSSPAAFTTYGISLQTLY